MTIIKCVHCGSDVEINIAKAIDEDGEVFKCPHCGRKFRYAEK